MKRRFLDTSIAISLAAVFMAISAPSAGAAVQAVTLQPTILGPHGATLNGKVFLEDQGAVAGFELGETTVYGRECREGKRH